MWSLLLALGDIEAIDDGLFHALPREWLTVFAEAFRRGLINRIVFGAAVRIVTTMRQDNVWPSWYTPCQITSCLRQSTPLGMMHAAEYATWRNLPPIVTIYRGGCADAACPGKAVGEIVQHVHWSLLHDVAVTYMRVRSTQRADDPTAGLPVIVRAEVPRELIFAFCNRNGEHEVLVDASRMTPGMVTDLGAANYLPRATAMAA